jgi:hypothetical protein
MISLISLLTNTLIAGQVAIGTGVVSIHFDDKTVVSFFDSPNDLNPKKTIQFFDDKSIKCWNIKDIEKHKTWLKPEVLWLDYNSFVFRCVDRKDDWFEVIVNNEDGSKYWIRRNNTTEFKTWETYLKKMFGISRLPDKTQNIRRLPTDNSEIVEYSGEDCFQIKSMKDDWIEIFTPDYCKDGSFGNKTNISSGWIRWKSGNELLIKYYITA